MQDEPSVWGAGILGSLLSHHWAISSPCARSDWNAGTSDRGQRPERSSDRCLRHRICKTRTCQRYALLSATTSESIGVGSLCGVLAREGYGARLVPAQCAAARLLQSPVQVASLCNDKQASGLLFVLCINMTGHPPCTLSDDVIQPTLTGRESSRAAAERMADRTYIAPP